MTATQKTWKIALGAHEWSKQTYAREPSNEYRLLGRAKRGMQFGALAIDRQDQYVLINGDYVTNIHSNAIKRAMEHAKRETPWTPQSHAAGVPIRYKRERLVKRPVSESDTAVTTNTKKENA